MGGYVKKDVVGGGEVMMVVCLDWEDHWAGCEGGDSGRGWWCYGWEVVMVGWIVVGYDLGDDCGSDCWCGGWWCYCLVVRTRLWWGDSARKRWRMVVIGLGWENLGCGGDGRGGRIVLESGGRWWCYVWVERCRTWWWWWGGSYAWRVVLCWVCLFVLLLHATARAWVVVERGVPLRDDRHNFFFCHSSMCWYAWALMGWNLDKSRKKLDHSFLCHAE